MVSRKRLRPNPAESSSSSSSNAPHSQATPLASTSQASNISEASTATIASTSNGSDTSTTPHHLPKQVCDFLSHIIALYCLIGDKFGPDP
jgi:hypothetical protein